MRLSSIVTLSALALVASGCAAFSDAATDGETRVAAAFYPLAFAAERVTQGTGAQVDLLTKPGTEPHDLELTIAETALVADADLVVYQADFQPAVDAAVEQNATGTALDVTDVVDLMSSVEHDHEHTDDEHTDDEHTDDEHTDDEHTESDGHDHGDLDPHFWLDPARVADLADGVADQLADLDPAHAATYSDNADALRDELTALDEEYATGLQRCERDTIVVSHNAFGYLEKYGVHVAPIAGLSPDAEPTPADLAELHELIDSDGITTVFSERLAPPQLAESLARDAGVTTAVLDPVEGLTPETPGEDYLSLMRANLDALRDANGCA